MSSEKSIEFTALLSDHVPHLGLPAAYNVRNLILTRIHELEQNIIEERAKFRAEVQARSKELGLTAADLFPPEPRPKAPPKYQNPIDPKDTWSGKGKTPNWVKAALDSGKTLDDLLIPTPDIDPDAGF